MNKEFYKMQKLAGIITESQFQEKLEENNNLDSDKLNALTKALSRLGGSKEDKYDYREIIQLLSNNSLAKAAETIYLLDTSPNEMVYGAIKNTYPELWDMLFDNKEGDYIALATPKKGLNESFS
jgi:ACT domain-containing protein